MIFRIEIRKLVDDPERLNFARSEIYKQTKAEEGRFSLLVHSPFCVAIRPFVTFVINGMSFNDKVVVLISANAEWQAVRAILPEITIQTSPVGEWFEHSLDLAGRREPVIFLHGGWGKIAAAASTQYAIDRWSPRLLVNLGTCGGFEGDIERGTLLLVDHTLVYDIFEQMGDCDQALAHYATRIDLSWLPEPYPQEVRRTLLVSGDRDLVAQDIPLLKARYGAVAGDWESGAIAYVAARNGVRCLILRGVSDLVGSAGGEAYGRLEVFAENTREIMRRLVGALPEWLARCRFWNSEGYVAYPPQSPHFRRPDLGPWAERIAGENGGK